MSSTMAIRSAGAVGAGPNTSQMHAAASNASAMPPSSDCSAERQDFSVRLRMAAIRARAATSGDHDHQRQQRGPPNGLHLSSFSRLGGYGASRYAPRLKPFAVGTLPAPAPRYAHAPPPQPRYAPLRQT